MLSIKLNITDDRFVPAKRLGKHSPEKLVKLFAKYLAKYIRDEYVRAIDKQLYATKMAPLSMSYRRYKETHHLSVKMFEATGLLKNSIVYKKRRDYYEVGIDDRKRYKNGIKVLDVAKYLEYGTSRMPARPMFRTIFNNIRKHIGRHWNKFTQNYEEIEKELKKIK